MSMDMQQFYAVFFEEAYENLARMETVLVALDLKAPASEELNEIFRAAHSIKGGAATFGFAEIAAITHVAETLLDRMRLGELRPKPEMIDALLQAVDVIKSQLEGRQLGAVAEPQTADAARVRLERMASAPDEDDSRPADEASIEWRVRFASTDPLDSISRQMADVGELGSVSDFHKIDDSEASVRWFEFQLSSDLERVELERLVSFVLQPEDLSIQSTGCQSAAQPATPPDLADECLEDLFSNIASAMNGEPTSDSTTAPLRGESDSKQSFPTQRPASEHDARDRVESPPKPDRTASLPAPLNEADAGNAARLPEASSIRVSVEKVDQLINLVGELVITQAMLAQTASGLDTVAHEDLFKGMGLLERSTRDLQESAMSIRMMPIGFVFNRFPRMVRELAAKLDKTVELKTTGESTELDKGLIEKIADPLTHLVRNAVDHGIEAPAMRRRSGKPTQGTIHLRAFHQGGNIAIEVSDDGAGLNRDRILTKARAQGLPVSDAMADQEVWQLIFEPGFSTADVVTDVSGRGVGMDVVRRNIQAIGGSIEIDSTLNVGTRILIRLPLTLAILDGLSVAVGDQTYIVPLTYIVESLQPRTDDIKSITNDGNVVHVRGEYLPIINSHEVFNVTPRSKDMSRGIMVIVESEGLKKALFVDELLGQHQVVIKSLETNYRKVHGISGATIMGDGRVALILDVGSLIRKKRPALQLVV